MNTTALAQWRQQNSDFSATLVREPTTLSGLLEKSVAYEEWRAPFDPRLQQAVQMSAIAILPAMIATYLAYDGMAFGQSSGVFGQQLFDAWMRGLAILSPLMVTMTLFSIVAGCFLVHKTNGLREGNQFWQRVAITISLIGVLNVVAAGVPLLIITINLVFLAVYIIAIAVFWIAIVVIALTVLLAIAFVR